MKLTRSTPSTPDASRPHGEGLECILLLDEAPHALVGALEVVYELLLLGREVRELGGLLKIPDLSGGRLEERLSTVQALLDESKLALRPVSDLIPSEALQCGRGSVENSRRQDRIGPPIAHGNDVREFDGLAAHPALDLILYVAGPTNHQYVAAVLIGRGLRGQP